MSEPVQAPSPAAGSAPIANGQIHGETMAKGKMKLEDFGRASLAVGTNGVIDATTKTAKTAGSTLLAKSLALPLPKVLKAIVG